MLADFRVPISWWELTKRTFRQIQEDNVPGLAAQLAYYFFLAIFPGIIFLIALATYFPLGDMSSQVRSWLQPVLPSGALNIVTEQMGRLGGQQNGGLLSIGLLGALWSASAALLATMDALNRAYDIDEGRPFWKTRGIAILLTTGLALFILVSFTLVVAGPQLASWIAGQFGLGDAFALAWSIVQWPVVFVLVVTGIGLVYYLAPDADQDWVWITPGSLVATILWIIASLGFRFYVVNFGSYEETYGTVGAVILLLFWFYISAFVLLVGAEMSAVIEHAAVGGKAPGEKVPGERRRLRGWASADAGGTRTGRPEPRPAFPAREPDPEDRRRVRE